MGLIYNKKPGLLGGTTTTLTPFGNALQCWCLIALGVAVVAIFFYGMYKLGGIICRWFI